MPRSLATTVRPTLQCCSSRVPRVCRRSASAIPRASAPARQSSGSATPGGAAALRAMRAAAITALGQSITASDQGDGTSENLTGLIETSADIQPGDSGGPLVNSVGKVIGMDTAASAGFSFAQGGSSTTQGFSIPIDTALKIADEITAGDSSSTVHIGPTAFLGLKVASPADGGHGAEIVSVVPGSPASQAGLAAGEHDHLARQPVGALAQLADDDPREQEARRVGAARLFRPFGHAAHGHRATCIGTAAVTDRHAIVTRPELLAKVDETDGFPR